MTQLKALYAEMEKFFQPLWPGEDKPLVFGEGRQDQPKIMLIGEAPGEQETLLLLLIEEGVDAADLDLAAEPEFVSGAEVIHLVMLAAFHGAMDGLVVLVHGDTTTSTAAALAAFYQQIPVGHVEAGLRSGNMYSPYPEEANRKLTGAMAALHFSPTPESRRNLLKENVSDEHIFVTGNTVIDALLATVKENYQFADSDIQALLDSDAPKVLITAHRRENQGEPMANIFRAVKRLHETLPEAQFIFPIHKNPKVRELAGSILGNLERVHIIEPMDYEPFANAIARVDLILTDSGGLQEEAPALGKPVLVMRDTTERPEALEAGTVKLVGTNYDKIVSEVSALLDNQEYYDVMSKAVNPYGDGLACKRIVGKFIK